MAKVKKKKNNRLVFWVQVVIAVILIGTMSIGFLQFSSNEGNASEAPDFPPWIAGLRVLKYMSGEDARMQMGDMFKSSPDLLRNSWVAFYDEDAVIWVGQADSKSQAEILLNTMRENTKSEIASAPDVKIATSSRKGVTIYGVKFNSQDNYFYQKKDKVFWLSVPAGKADAILGEAVDGIN